MKLSILDQAPISKGQTAKEALEASVELAQLGDKLGYERFWIAEHHDLFGLASPNPAVMLSMIGSKTKRIRIGAGAVLLPYYKPFHIAETYNLLASLFPGRVDLGLGRAPGGSAEVSMALTDNYLEEVRLFPEAVDTLQRFLHDDFSPSEPNGKISPTPVPDTAPVTWILGTSEKSAQLAAANGMSYCFGDFMTEADGPRVVQAYQEAFDKRAAGNPYVIVAVNVICASTTEEAENLASSQIVWKLKQDKLMQDTTIPSVKVASEYEMDEEEHKKVSKMKQRMIVGNPEQVVKELQNIQEKYQADELMIVTITHEKEAKQRSYELVKKQLFI